MVDAANACVFVRARDIGLTGTELPDALEANQQAMSRLGAVRLAASVAMGIAGSAAEAAQKVSNPAIGFVSGPQDAKLLSGAAARAGDMGLTARMLARGHAHRALPLMRTLCMAVAARIEGTIVNEAARRAGDSGAELRIGMPSGVMVATASVRNRDGRWEAEQGGFLRTQRRLFDGNVLVRAPRVT